MAVSEQTVNIPPPGLEGTLSLPAEPTGTVIFAHGSGSSRLSPRNRSVAAGLNDAGIATLLFDLLTGEEGADRRNVFDIPLLAERLALAHDWLADNMPDSIKGRPVAYFGASTGAAAALIAAAEKGESVAAPTLLIVGGNDYDVLALNRQAYKSLTCEKELEIVPGATHLFEEPGALETVTKKAADWFNTHFAAPQGS